MDLTLNNYGAWEVELSDGSAMILREGRGGGLEVAARDGRLVIRPNVSNEVVIQVESHFPDRKVEAAKDRVQEFLRQRARMSHQHPTEVYTVAGDPEADAAALLAADLKLLAGES